MECAPRGRRRASHHGDDRLPWQPRSWQARSRCTRQRFSRCRHIPICRRSVRGAGLHPIQRAGQVMGACGRVFGPRVYTRTRSRPWTCWQISRRAIENTRLVQQIRSGATNSSPSWISTREPCAVRRQWAAAARQIPRRSHARHLAHALFWQSVPLAAQGRNAPSGGPDGYSLRDCGPTFGAERAPPEGHAAASSTRCAVTSAPIYETGTTVIDRDHSRRQALVWRDISDEPLCNCCASSLQHGDPRPAQPAAVDHQQPGESSTCWPNTSWTSAFSPTCCTGAQRTEDISIWSSAARYLAPGAATRWRRTARAVAGRGVRLRLYVRALSWRWAPTSR